MPSNHRAQRGNPDSFIAGILDDDDDDIKVVPSGALSAGIPSMRNLRGNVVLDESVAPSVAGTNYASLPVTATRRHDNPDVTPTSIRQSSKGSHDSSEVAGGLVSPAYVASVADDDDDIPYHPFPKESNASKEMMKGDRHMMQQAQPLFRYALIFINFSFVVAAMLMIMAGIVARENSAVKLCSHCGDLTTVSMVFGILLWMFALFGFNWIRQHNILLLLVYAVFLVFLILVLVVVIITGGAYDANTLNAGGASGSTYLDSWIAAVTSNNTADVDRICKLEVQLNCSGFYYGCCTPGVCFPNVTNTSGGSVPVPPPSWYDDICPQCDTPPVPRPCTEGIYSTVRKNLGGFLVISGFSLLLVLTGVMLAVLSRKVNLLLDAARGSAIEVVDENKALESSVRR